jgi:hypothetical protein
LAGFEVTIEDTTFAAIPCRSVSPDLVNDLGAMDLLVRSNQREPLDQRGSSDNAIRWIFGISCWKSHGARARAAADRKDSKPGLDFLQEGFEADADVDPAIILTYGEARARQGSNPTLPSTLFSIKYNHESDLYPAVFCAAEASFSLASQRQQEKERERRSCGKCRCDLIGHVQYACDRNQRKR